MEEAVVAGRTALVTGASGGLGAAFARELAARGADLVLVARRQDRLEAVRNEITAEHQVMVDLVPMDLGDRDSPAQLCRRLSDDGRAVDILVNNAGFGLYGEFLQIEWEKELAMLELDIVTLVHMTKLFLPPMVDRNHGHLLHVASIGAYQPTPTYATYSAAKSFVLSFGEALNYELRGTNVSSTVVAPGIVATEFLQVSGQEATRYQRAVMMQPDQVARIAIRHMLRGTPSVVPGRLNAITAWSNRFLPRRASTALAHRLMQR